MILKEKSHKILKAFYRVYNTLGYGFLEKVYHNSMMIELGKEGLKCKSQYPVTVYYDDAVVGDYRADILVDDCIILELKASEALCEENDFQLLNYLRGTDIELGFLLNFGKKAEFRRKIFTNDKKRRKEQSGTQ